jgi:hypothetical protein
MQPRGPNPGKLEMLTGAEQNTAPLNHQGFPQSSTENRTGSKLRANAQLFDLLLDNRMQQGLSLKGTERPKLFDLGNSS